MKPNTKVISVSPDRNNIMYTVQLVKKGKEMDKLKWIVNLFFEAKTKQSDNLVKKVMWSFRFVPKYTVHCGIQRHECLSNQPDNYIFVFTLFKTFVKWRVLTLTLHKSAENGCDVMCRRVDSGVFNAQSLLKLIAFGVCMPRLKLYVFFYVPLPYLPRNSSKLFIPQLNAS